VPDPGNPGGGDMSWGAWPWPPNYRWETDAEFRDRVKAALAREVKP